jgi:microcystin-dependent protein
MATAFGARETVLRQIRRYSLAHPHIVGDTKLSALAADHERWLLCDGRLLRRDRYPELFAAVGYAFGGDGNRFALPDGRGRVPAAVSEARLQGDAVGSETHTLAVEELAEHSHTINASATGVQTNSDGSHTHTATTDSAGTHTHTVSNTVIQNGQNTRVNADNHDLPWSEINLDNAQTTTTSASGAHTHTLTTAASGTHTHVITDPTHAHTANTTGESVPFNIMQPTLFVGNLFIFCGRRVTRSRP